ncbi:transposase [Elysia marginata]|uniref:Transposase n=1 Tax=Elysia marginata TaxID=1093978 RepID=A0AAV4GRV1_9GAST|nr:transposase [Elysia marginata]
MFEPHGPKRLFDTVKDDETWFPVFIIPPKCLNRMWVDEQGDRPVVLCLDFQSRPHKARATTQSLQELGIQVLPYPAYSPDFAPCDFWLFPILKDRLAGRKFGRVQDLAKTVNSDLRTIPEEDYQGVFRKWQIRLKRCIESHGEYFEGL